MPLAEVGALTSAFITSSRRIKTRKQAKPAPQPKLGQRLSSRVDLERKLH